MELSEPGTYTTAREAERAALDACARRRQPYTVHDTYRTDYGRRVYEVEPAHLASPYDTREPYAVAEWSASERRAYLETD